MSGKTILAGLLWLAAIGFFTACSVIVYTVIMVGEALLRSLV